MSQIEKQHTESALMARKKKDLVEHISCLEHNNNVLYDTINQQAINFRENCKECKGQLYVLTSRYGTTMFAPKVFLDAATAHNNMKAAYELTMAEYKDADSEYDDEDNLIVEGTCDYDHSFEDNYAYIDYAGDWTEWSITACEVVSSDAGN